MIGVGLVGLITVFAASARTSVDAAIDRSMKADYVVTSPGFGQGSIPLEAQQQLAALPNVELASGIRSGQAKIEGSVEQVIAADPTKIDSLFDLQPTQGKISELDRRTGSRCSTPPPSDNGWKVGDTVPLEFAQTGKQEFTVESIYQQTGFTNYVITPDAYEKNFRDQFDSQVYVNTKGGVTPANTAAIKKVMQAVPRSEGADPRRVQGVAGGADRPVPEPGLRAAVLRHRDRALRHRQHARALDHRAPPRARACSGRSA